MSITDAVPVEDAVVEASHRYFVDSTQADQGVSTATGDRTIKDFVDSIGTSKKATLYFLHDFNANTTAYTLTTSETIPSNILLQIENGAVIDGAGTLTINSVFNPGVFQVFGSSVTILFGVATAGAYGGGTTDIHPEWWGVFPNGSNDTTVLNKAIAAADVVGTYDGLADANIIVRPGRYWIAHNSLSTIKTNFYAPHASFTAIGNTSLLGKLFQFDFTEPGDRTVYIGAIFGDPLTTMFDVAHYNIGVNILGGDGVWMRIDTLASLYIGISSDGPVHEEHVGFWDIEIDTIIGCEYGINVKSGTTGIKSAFEVNRIYVKYATHCGAQVLNIDSTTVDSAVIFQNVFHFTSVELHNFANLSGFRLVGSATFGNKIIVDGSLIPPTGTGDIVTLHTDAYDNLFELSYMDWSKFYSTPPSAGYNIFRATSNQNTSYPAVITNNFGRSEIMLDAAPTVHPWREGDKAWNNSPSDGILGWVCTVSGTPGIWAPMGYIRTPISYENGTIFYENELIYY